MSSKRRVKPYRPRAVGRPVMARMRDDLIVPAHIALRSIERSDNTEALSSAGHTLGALLNTMLAALHSDRRPTVLIRAGMDALQGALDRQARTGVLRCTGPELAALRAAITHADEMLPLLRTDKIIAALLKVDRAMARIEAAAEA